MKITDQTETNDMSNVSIEESRKLDGIIEMLEKWRKRNLSVLSHDDAWILLNARNDIYLVWGDIGGGMVHESPDVSRVVLEFNELQ